MKQTKRYSVFVSSTFEDLKSERAKVYETILRLNGIPVGMESFSASSNEQLAAIKTLIDTCDYLVAISAARYGSIHSGHNKSFSELEFDYAKETKKPILAFVHRNIETIPIRHHDNESKSRNLLRKFHDRLKEGRVCAFFESAEELAKEISTALSSEFHDNPQTGWIRADCALETGEPSAEGLWEFVPDPQIGKDQEPAVTDGVRRLKIYSGSCYMVLWYDRSSGKVRDCHGGRYRLTRNQYEERCLFASEPGLSRLGKIGTATLEVSSSLMHHLDPGRMNEVFRRVDI